MIINLNVSMDQLIMSAVLMLTLSITNLLLVQLNTDELLNIAAGVSGLGSLAWFVALIRKGILKVEGNVKFRIGKKQDQQDGHANDH